MSDELKQLLEFLQREADHTRTISPTITQSELSMVLAHIRSLTSMRDAACNRSEYWKAEKLAADTEIEDLRARVAELEEKGAQPAVVPEVAFCTGIRELVHSAFMILDDSEDMGDGTFMIDGEIAQMWTKEMNQALISLGVLEHSHINERFGNPPGILSTTDTEVK